VNFNGNYVEDAGEDHVLGEGEGGDGLDEKARTWSL
jgi:hypothetical protein